jgi:hypothetical protein
LHQDIEHVAVLIDGPPQIVPFAVDPEKDFIEVPLISRLRLPAPELIGILLAKCPAPLPNRFVSDNDATGEQEFFHVAIAETEPEIQPDPMADDLVREAVVLVAVR